MTNPRTMRLWSLVAVLLLPVVRTESTTTTAETSTSTAAETSAESTTSYPINECICDLKLAKEAEESTSSSKRRKREANPDPEADADKRLLFGFELEAAVEEGNKVTTLEEIKNKINEALTAETELQSSYDSVAVGEMIDLKKVYMYINLKVEATEDIKRDVDTALMAKQEATEGNPTNWFGQNIVAAAGEIKKAGDPTLIIAGPATMMSLSFQLSAPSLETDGDRTTVREALEAKVKQAVKDKPVLKVTTAFSVREAVTITIDFYQTIDEAQFEATHKTLVSMDLPDGYVEMPNSRIVLLGPVSSYVPAQYATFKVTVADQQQTTFVETMAKVHEALKNIEGYGRVFSPAKQPAQELPMIVQFSTSISEDAKNEIQVKLKELKDDSENKINDFTAITEGLDFMTNPTNCITSTFTFAENATDGEKEAAVTSILEKMEEPEVKQKLGIFASNTAKREGNRVIVESSFLSPVILFSSFDPIKDAINEKFADFAEATHNDVSRGSEEVRKSGKRISAQFTVNNAADLSSFDPKDFADTLTDDIKESDSKPEDFLWVDSASKAEDDKINVYFRFKETSTDITASMTAVLTKLTESKTIGGYTLKDEAELFKIPIPGVTTTTESEETTSTESTTATGVTSSTESKESTATESTETTGGGGSESTGGGSSETTGGGGSESTTAAGETTGGGGGETTSATPSSVVIPETKYKGKKVTSSGTVEDCECDVECSVEMKFKATGFPYKDAYEDTSSKDFKDDSAPIKSSINTLMQKDSTLGPYFIDSIVTQFIDKDTAVEIVAEIQLSDGYDCDDANDDVGNVTDKEAKSGSFAGVTVDKDSFSYAQGTTDSNKHDRHQTTTTPMTITTAEIVYEDHDYFLTITIPVMVGVLLLIILIMCCMRKDSLCCKIFAADGSESTKLVA